MPKHWLHRDSNTFTHVPPNVTSRLKWNTPELHTAQLLDYLSQFPWIVTEANTRYMVNHTASAMLPIP